MTKTLIFKSFGTLKLKLPVEVIITQKRPGDFWVYGAEPGDILGPYYHHSIRGLREQLAMQLEYLWSMIGNAQRGTKLTAEAWELRKRMRAHVYGPWKEIDMDKIEQLRRNVEDEMERCKALLREYAAISTGAFGATAIQHSLNVAQKSLDAGKEELMRAALLDLRERQ